jgi:hypothetical protein
MRCALVGAVLVALAAPAQAGEPANSIKAMFDQLKTCIGSLPLPVGTDVTLQFSLNRRGGLIGKPRLSHAHWEGDDAAQKSAAIAISAAFDRCVPVTITDGLGGAIAGRQLLFRIVGSAHREEKA